MKTTETPVKTHAYSAEAVNEHRPGSAWTGRHIRQEALCLCRQETKLVCGHRVRPRPVAAPYIHINSTGAVSIQVPVRCGSCGLETTLSEAI